MENETYISESGKVYYKVSNKNLYYRQPVPEEAEAIQKAQKRLIKTRITPAIVFYCLAVVLFLLISLPIIIYAGAQGVIIFLVTLPVYIGIVIVGIVFQLRASSLKKWTPVVLRGTAVKVNRPMLGRLNIDIAHVLVNINGTDMVTYAMYHISELDKIQVGDDVIIISDTKHVPDNYVWSMRT